jgi:hypothetical protein
MVPFAKIIESEITQLSFLLQQMHQHRLQMKSRQMKMFLQ